MVVTIQINTGARNYFEVGGKRLPRSKVTPTQNKNSRIGPLFLGENQVNVQKQTKIKMNDIDSPKLGGRRPTLCKLGGGKLPGPTVPHPAQASLI